MMSTIRSLSGVGCFLCDPEPENTWMGSERFRAVLGVGPVGEGFTLIAVREHVSSMLDLDDLAARELSEFTGAVRRRLASLYGPTTVAEHGRIAPCVASAATRHEPHCLHAHRLVFPGHQSVDIGRAAPRMNVSRFNSFAAVRRGFRDPGQYVYAEGDDGTCQVAPVNGPLPRQFLRAAVACEQGRPYLADWRAHPGFAEMQAARLALGIAAAA